ncbi:MAG: lamin tail domain-containing protein, partial [Verrucomicrobiae bacterium]|nr:lamin tail domain-containing protein [Verrucomicrobiae bacterium]
MKSIMQRLAAVFAGLVLGLALYIPVSSPGAELLISEFMAANGGLILDEDGDSSDWIEIHNVSSNTVNLLNWALTDNANNLNRWRFPATNLGPNRFMVVWASGKNRREPGRPLHTNFRLPAEGRFLALVRPEGTIESQYAPSYPQQFQNVSYGLPMLVTNYLLVATNALARIRVPVDGALGTNWTALDFDDGTWATATNGIGFDVAGGGGGGGAQAILNAAPRMYYRFNEVSGTTAVNAATNLYHATYNGVTLGAAGVRPPGQAGFEANNTCATFNGSSSYATAGSAMIVGAPAFTMMAWIRPTATPRARDGLFGQNDSLEFGWLNSGTPQIHLWTPSGSFSWNYPYPINEWHHVAAVGDSSGIRLYVDGVQVASGTGSASYGTSASPFNIGGGGILDASGNFFTGDMDEVAVWLRALSAAEITQIYQAALTPASLANLVRSDVRSVMQNQNASVYARFKFNVEDPLAVDRLLLRMRYEDGFAAFLNGQLVASANAPDTLAWNAAALTDRSKSQALGWETFDLADYLALLRPGTNVLAIQGLNESAASGDFLLEAELSYTSAGNYEFVPRYFLTATPGDFNGVGTRDLGPVISNDDYSPRPQPNPGQSLTITARVAPTFNAVSNVLLYYRVMYNNTSVISMRDDGSGGDVTAGDGIYTAIIPGATNGQMIRWYFQAQDVQGRTSRWPLFQDPLGSAEYFGTVVADSNLVSKLPIIHLFVSNYTANVGVDDPNKTGGRASVFYDGEFYDNVFMRVRGNTTRSYTKKSHRLEFNREKPFRHPGPGGGRLRKTSFVADYPDPTYMRQGLSFWLCEMFGSPGTFYHPVRLQMNGAFYQLANHNDLHGEELLERLGWDPNGALYNAAGQVTPGKASTGGFDKKTRRWDTTDADYLELANKIAESLPTETRRINALDLFDVPNVLNYLCVARWVHENDDVWANMTLYHDNDGDGLWRIIGFDMNLSWGAIFAEGDASLYTGVQATNDNHKAHPLYGSSQALALSGPSGAYNRVYDTFFLVPQLRQMYLRRLRTLMDTWILPPDAPPGSSPVEQRIYALRDYIAEEAIRDRARWGWPSVGGQNNFTPGIDIYTGVQQMVEQFFYPRRQHFFGKHCITNTALPIGITKANNAGIPLPQPTNAVLDIVDWEVNPASGNQDQEYICVTNRNNLALDISGWRLHGGVRFTFKPGTVVPATGAVYVARSVPGFKSRTTGPRPGQGLVVVGGYDGQLSTWGDVILLSDDRGRLVSSNSYPPSPSLAQQYLRITEVMYNPPAVAGDPTYKEEYEFVELKNVSTNVTLNLTGIRFTQGIEFNFTGSSVTSLGPGQRVLVVKNRTAFTNRYGAGLSIAGEYSGYLNNDGETLRLVDATGEKILEFTYNNNWQPLADGLGGSLVVVNELADWRAWESREQWRVSTSENGSPGQDDLAPPPLLPVLVNEVMANSGSAGGDWVELYNPNPAPVSLAHWWLSDDFNTPKKYRFPANASIPANGYLVLTEAQFNPNGQGFAFGAGGDDVYLFSGNSAGQLTGYYHGFSFGASPVGVTYGRYVTELGEELFVLQASNTMGAANSGPLASPIVVNEIMYRPPDLLVFDPIGFNPAPYKPVDNTRDEYIELWNTTTNTLALGSPTGTNAWRLRGGVDFDFPTNAVIPAGGYILLVNFNPADAALAAAFRTLYQVPPGVALYGPYRGKLNNDNDTIRLQQFFQGNYVDMDAFTYRDNVPWPCGADGNGRSLHRLSPRELGADPLNWAAQPPTAGAPTVPQTRGLASLVAGPANVAVATNGTAVLSVDVCSPYPVSYQWRFNGQNLPGENNSILVIPNAQLANSGYYSVIVSNRAGAFETAPAWVSVQVPPRIVEQPASQTVLAFGEAVLRVGVEPTPPYWVQWRFNGANYF